MAAISIGSFSVATATAPCRTIRTKSKSSNFRPKISCEWDPEGIFPPMQTGHIVRREFQRRLEKDSEAREAYEQFLREEKERRAAVRESRVIPDTKEQLVEYFLDTEAQEIEFEIARLRPRLDEEFFSHLKYEIGQIRFAVSKTEAMEDRIIELEALQKALKEGTEAYDKLQSKIISARENLTKILTSKDVKATILELVERNELNRALLTLLDENIANAHGAKQDLAAAFMEKIRAAILKYMTVSKE